MLALLFRAQIVILPVGAIVLALFVTSRARMQTSGWLFATVSTLFVIIIVLVIGNTLLTERRNQQWTLGKPIFGEMGGINSRPYASALRASRELQLEFEGEDAAAANLMSDFDAQITEEAFRHLYESSGQMGGRHQVADEEWNEVWRTQFLEGGRVGDLSFQDTISKDDLSFNVVLPRLLGAHVMVSLTGLIGYLTVVVLSVLYLNDEIAFVLLAQVTVVSALFMASLVYLYHSYQGNTVSFVRPGGIPDEVIGRIDASLDEVTSLTVRPSRTLASPAYFREVRLYYLEVALRDGLWRVAALSVVLASVFVISSIWTLEFGRDHLVWLLRLLLVVGGFVLGAALTLYGTFYALGRAKIVMYAVGSALAIALLPSALTYIVKGEADLIEIQSAVLAILSGLGATVTAVLVGRSEGPSV